MHKNNYFIDKFSANTEFIFPDKNVQSHQKRINFSIRITFYEPCNSNL